MVKNRIIIKVGTSTLTYENGKANLRRIEGLCNVISDLHNQGKEIIFVSSGAIGMGIGKAGPPKGALGTKEKQAYAAVGQCELMFLYDKFFREYNQTIAQILLTNEAVESFEKRHNILNTINTLLDMDIIPIINENDTVSIDEIEGSNFSDNDMLSAIVAKLVSAERLIILTDIDGLHDKDPRKYEDASRISIVEKITDELFDIAGGTGSKRGTGGMLTKLKAALFAVSSGIECHVISGEKPERLYSVFAGEDVGTTFRICEKIT